MKTSLLLRDARTGIEHPGSKQPQTLFRSPTRVHTQYVPRGEETLSTKAVSANLHDRCEEKLESKFSSKNIQCHFYSEMDHARAIAKLDSNRYKGIVRSANVQLPKESPLPCNRKEYNKKILYHSAVEFQVDAGGPNLLLVYSAFLT